MPETSEIKGSHNSRKGMDKKEMGQIRTEKYGFLARIN